MELTYSTVLSIICRLELRGQMFKTEGRPPVSKEPPVHLRVSIAEGEGDARLEKATPDRESVLVHC